MSRMKSSAIATTERLALALEALGDIRLKGMIERARAGVYDDFKTDLAYPKHTLVVELRVLGHHGFAQRVEDGEFEATEEEAEEWWKGYTTEVLNKTVKGHAVL